MTLKEIRKQSRELNKAQEELNKAQEDLKNKEDMAITDRGNFFINEMNNKSCVVNVCKKTYGEPTIYFSTTSAGKDECDEDSYYVKCTLELNNDFVKIRNIKEAKDFLYSYDGGLINKIDCPNLFAGDDIDIIDSTWSSNSNITTLQWVSINNVCQCSWITDAILNGKLKVS